MRARSTISKILPTLVLILLSACSYTTQATSGKDWLAAGPQPLKINLNPGDIDSAVRDAADVEPTLRFPARIGIARLDRSGLSVIPAPEAKAWTDAAARLGPDFGEFVPISPLVAAMLTPDEATDVRINPAHQAIDLIRLAAARQHLDAVIVYETDATSDTRGNPLSLAEWTLIGAFVLPSEEVKAVGAAQAMLIDVRNGYPYGTVRASSDDKTVAVRFQIHDTAIGLADKVREDAVAKLAIESEAMLRKLRPELAALDSKPKRH